MTQAEPSYVFMYSQPQGQDIMMIWKNFLTKITYMWLIVPELLIGKKEPCIKQIQERKKVTVKYHSTLNLPNGTTRF